MRPTMTAMTAASIEPASAAGDAARNLARRWPRHVADGCTAPVSHRHCIRTLEYAPVHADGARAASASSFTARRSERATARTRQARADDRSRPGAIPYLPCRDRARNNTSLRGESADAGSPLSQPDHVSVFCQLLEEGAARGGRTLDGFDIAPVVTRTFFLVSRLARNLNAPGIALYVGGMGSRKQTSTNTVVSANGFCSRGEESGPVPGGAQ